MFYTLLILSFLFDLSHSNHPILFAKPYPFNRSESSLIQCFSNELGIVLSLTIVATMLDTDMNHPFLQYSENNIAKNGSIILTIPAPFNYSQLDSKIECRSIYHYGEQKLAQLDVLSVVEMPQQEQLSLNIHAKQMAIINCLTYGTNVFVHWNFSKDISKAVLDSLPIGIRLEQTFIVNDTLMIDHVSYSDHHGYYRCSGTNRLLGRTYEDNSVIYLNVKKNTIWIFIVIAIVVIGICVFILIFCSKYWQRKRKKQLLEETETSQKEEELIGKIKQIVQSAESIEFTSSYDGQNSSERRVESIEESITRQKNVYTLSHSENNTNSRTTLSLTEDNEPQRSSPTSSFTFRHSPRFVLSNPFLDPHAQLISSIKQ